MVKLTKRIKVVTNTKGLIKLAKQPSIFYVVRNQADHNILSMYANTKIGRCTGIQTTIHITQIHLLVITYFVYTYALPSK